MRLGAPGLPAGHRGAGPAVRGTGGHGGHRRVVRPELTVLLQPDGRGVAGGHHRRDHCQPLPRAAGRAGQPNRPVQGAPQAAATLPQYIAGCVGPRGVHLRGTPLPTQVPAPYKLPGGRQAGGTGIASFVMGFWD